MDCAELTPHLALYPYRVAKKYALEGTPLYDEIASRGMLAVARKLPEYDPDKASLKTFLFWVMRTVVEHVCRNRRCWFAHGALPLVDYEPPRSRERRPGAAAEAAETLGLILAPLDAKDRQVLLLYHAGYTFAEIARDWGVSPQRIQVRYLRAMTRARREVRRKGLSNVA